MLDIAGTPQRLRRFVAMAANPTDRAGKSSREPYPAEEARQGEIILRRPWQRWVFGAGLAGMVVLALIGAVWMLD